MTKTQFQASPDEHPGGSRVAAFLDAHMALSEKTLREIAEEIGYTRPNVLSNMRSGVTKLPITKVMPMAKALGVDPMRLLKITLEEYTPESLEAIEQIAGYVVTENEREMLKVIRDATADTNPKLRQRDREGLLQHYHTYYIYTIHTVS